MQLSICIFLVISVNNMRSRDSAVGIASGYGMNDQEVEVPVGSRIFFSPCLSDPLWGPPNFLLNWYRGGLSPEVNRPGREADISPPASAEVKIWIYISTLPYAFMA
jgi:hypothetical protein